MSTVTIGRRVRRWLVTPGLVGFVASPRLRSRPHGLYRVLRALDPTHHSPLGIWLLSGQEDVAGALRHPGMGSDEAKADKSAINMRFVRRGRPEPTPEELTARHNRPFFRLNDKLMLFMDPPDHPRVRGLVAKAFTPRRVEGLAPRVGGDGGRDARRIGPPGWRRAVVRVRLSAAGPGHL